MTDTNHIGGGAVMIEHVWIEVVRGRDGSACVCICDDSGSGQRVGGGKPWGGGTTIHRWKVDAAEAIEAITRISAKPEGGHG